MSSININASSGSSGIFVDTDTFSNLRAGTGTTVFHLSTFGADAVNSGTEMGRFFAFFDLSGIPSGSVINSATLRIPAVGNLTQTAGGTSFIGSHIGNDPVAADATHWNSKTYHNDWGSLSFASFSAGGNNDISFTSTGIAALTIGAVNKISLIHSSDFNNAAPSGTDQFTSTAANWILIIDYTAPANQVKGYSFLM